MVEIRAAVSRVSAEKSPGREQQKKQNRKISPFSLFLLYQYHVWKSRGHRPCCRRPWLLLSWRF